MYNTYLLPVYDAEAAICYIEPITAINLQDAKDKFIQFYNEVFDLNCSDWDELEQTLCEKTNIIIGEIYDKEEF